MAHLLIRHVVCGEKVPACLYLEGQVVEVVEEQERIGRLVATGPEARDERIVAAIVVRIGIERRGCAQASDKVDIVAAGKVKLATAIRHKRSTVIVLPTHYI